MISRRSLKKMTTRVVFFPDKCNKCEIQAACNGYLGEHVNIQVVHVRVSTISAAAVVLSSVFK